MVDRYNIDPGFECGGLDAKGDYVKYEDYKRDIDKLKETIDGLISGEIPIGLFIESADIPPREITQEMWDAICKDDTGELLDVVRKLGSDAIKRAEDAIFKELDK